MNVQLNLLVHTDRIDDAEIIDRANVVLREQGNDDEPVTELAEAVAVIINQDDENSFLMYFGHPAGGWSAWVVR